MAATVPVIESSGLSKSYGARIGVRDLDLSIGPGEVFGFLGPNGAGKTTTIRLLLGLIGPTRGSARLFGIAPSDPRSRLRVGYLPGELSLDGRMTGRATLRFLETIRGTGTAREVAVRRRRLCDRLGLLDADLRCRVREYSRGMKQKIGLVAALQHDPNLVILDEPTTGLDPLVREELFALLEETRRAGKTVFHSSHVLSEVDRSCTRVGILREGRLLRVLAIDEVRHASARRMIVRFAGRAPLEELAAAGAEPLADEDGSVVLRVSSGLDPILTVLARHPVRDLAFPEPSLDEAFADYYRTAGGNAP